MILDLDKLNLAVNAISMGGVIAYPTEAVWGLGCIPWNKEAVYRLLEVKSRPVDKGLILVGASEEQFESILGQLNTGCRKKLTLSWPGPYTWVIPDLCGWAPPWIRGEFDSVAIRVSNHPLVRYLCFSLGGPLVSTSANKVGEQPLLKQYEVENKFAGCVDFIAPGETGGDEKPSEIRNIINNEVIRSGHTTSL